MRRAAARYAGLTMPRVTPAADLATTLAPIALTSAEGSTVRLGDLWARAPRVLVHLRHFG